MQVYHGLGNVSAATPRGRAVAIGVFDGVHLGHQRILGEAVKSGAETGASVLAVTFQPHPDAILRPEPPKLLTTLGRKADIIAAIGVDELLVIKFDRDFAKLDPGEFCDKVLSKHLGAIVVLVGENFSFGHHGAGTPDGLRSYGRSHGFEVKTVPLAEDGGDTISSTRIRGLVGEGRVAEAASLLGRPHRIEGTVEHGAGRGRTLDAPTANLAVEAEAAVPAQGVYVTRALVDDRRIHPAVTSVGTNPTFEAGEDVHIETLFLDEGQDVYGRHMALDFIERVRGQKVFATADALTGQIKADADFAREYLRDHPIA